MKSFLLGILGGVTVLSLLILCFFSFNLYNYSIKIVNPTHVEVSEKYSEKAKLIRELENDGILLTPQEYTSNVISYYNTALTILAAMLIIFSVVGYFHLKFLSSKQIHDSLRDSLKDSKEFETIITETIFGKAEDVFASLSKMDGAETRIGNIETSIEVLKEEIEFNNDDFIEA